MSKNKRKKAPGPRNWKPALLWAARLAGVGLLAGVMLYAFLQLGKNLVDSPHFQLRRIGFQGVRHLDRASLEELIFKTVPKSLWLIDLDGVRRLVESEKWVKQAVVRREFPDALRVYVRERTPVTAAVIDDRLMVVDAEGAILDGYGPTYGDLDRPIVMGLKNTALENAREENQTRMRLYLDLLNRFDQTDPAYSQQLSEVDVSDLERVAVIPTKLAIPVYLGREKFIERYRTFLSQTRLLEKLRRQHGVIESIDLTVEDRMIVHTPQGNRTETSE